MYALKLNIRQVFNVTGEKKTIYTKIPIEELDYIKGLTFASPIEVSGECFNRADVVNLVFNVTVTLSLKCDRCLTDFERQYTYPCKHIVVKSLNNHNDDDDYIVADGDYIDITPIAVSDLLLQLPSKYLCKEDCKGLCQHCGKNLNYGDCDCCK